MKPWTSSSAIAKNNWNTLKVIANGTNLKFYINGTLAWSGTDSKFASERVGLEIYQGTVVHPMNMDWATFGAQTATSDIVEEGQMELIPDPTSPFVPWASPYDNRQN